MSRTRGRIRTSGITSGSTPTRLPPDQHLRDRTRGRQRAQGARRRKTSGRGCFGYAERRSRQHQCADDHVAERAADLIRGAHPARQRLRYGAQFAQLERPSKRQCPGLNAFLPYRDRSGRSAAVECSPLITAIGATDAFRGRPLSCAFRPFTGPTRKGRKGRIAPLQRPPRERPQCAP